jgi:hypothetical protein
VGATRDPGTAGHGWLDPERHGRGGQLGALRRGVDEQGQPIEIVDRLAPSLTELARKGGTAFIENRTLTKDAYSDVLSRLHRRKTLSLSAEMQWELLPPLSFGTDRVVVTGGLEPAYDVGGDSFDYALNGTAMDLAVIDSVGHGLPAAVLASVAISAYRHARRNARWACRRPGLSAARPLMRHVLSHQADQLQDDASIVILEWRTGDEQVLQL